MEESDKRTMVERKPFQGVLNILSFNRHFYYFGFAALAGLWGIHHFFNWNGITFWLSIIGFAYGLLMPLIVSAYVYDFSGYYKLDWLDPIFTNKEVIQKIVNINAGFDETSFILESKFKNASLNVYDFYDEEKHTETAIVRARKVSLVYPNTRSIDSSKVPLPINSVDAIFL
ncbi:MAG: methyltransferase type 11, partial [Bacteroidota bacterium]